MRATDGQDSVRYDVVVVGGGAAGLSGALTLGRARRSVLVVDGGEPRNAPASGVHGFLTRDGVNPSALLEAGQEEVRCYGADLLDGRVASAERVEDGFGVTSTTAVGSAPGGCSSPRGSSTSCRTCRESESAGGVTYCIARTVTGGRSVTRPSVYWPAGRFRRTRRCCSVS